MTTNHRDEAAKYPNTVGIVAWVEVTACAAFAFFGNLRFGNSVMGIGFEDDFFYYLAIARNLAFQGRSTFDGTHLTNGYHPLWMVVVAALTKVFGSGGLLHAASDVPFAASFETLQFTVLLSISWCTLRAARAFCGPSVSITIQLLLTSFAIMMLRSGMEVGLTLALVFALLYWRVRPEFSWTKSSTFFYGFLAGLIVLSRLDTALLVALLFLLDVLPKKIDSPGGRARSLVFWGGLIPVGLYFVVNEAVFHTLMPVSGAAKQLRLHHTPSAAALSSFLGYFRHSIAPLTGPAVLATLCGLVLLIKGSTKSIGAYRGFFAALLLFAPVQLATLSVLSDWPLWFWYLYPWLISGTVGVIVIFAGNQARLSIPRMGFVSVTLSGALLLAECVVLFVRTNPAANTLYLSGVDIREFAKQHPGTYAMGDRSGTVNYVAGLRLIQLEGLMMDKAYLAHIRAQADLRDVLKEYGVRYYIASDIAAPAGGCYLVKEPSVAGPDSLVLHGRICGPPLATYVHGFHATYVFDVQQ